MSARMFAALAAVYVIWGSTYLAMRIVVESIPAFMMASVRFLLIGGVLLVVARVRGGAWPTWREWWAAAPVGFLMFVLGNGTVAFAEKSLSSGIAAVVCGTMPLWAAAFGPFFGTRTTAREWVGMALGLAGVAVLGFGGELRAEPLSAVLLMAAPLSWALGSLLAKARPLAKGLWSPATQMVWGGVTLAIASLLVGERAPASVPLKSLLAWVYLAIGGSLIAYTAYMYLLNHARPAVATSYSFVNPAVAVLLGVAFGGEAFTREMAVALLLIVVATVLVVLRPRTEVESAPRALPNKATR